jgi:hypothetical protein
VEFGPFGLSVKDLAAIRVLARYNSTCPLYTLPLPTSTTPTPCGVPYALTITASSPTWHRRLGHPGSDVLSKLSSGLAITCPRSRDAKVYIVDQYGVSPMDGLKNGQAGAPTVVPAGAPAMAAVAKRLATPVAKGLAAPAVVPVRALATVPVAVLAGGANGGCSGWRGRSRRL